MIAGPSREGRASPHTLLVAAATLGLLGEYLFSPGLLGLNVLLWTGALVTAIVVLARLGRISLAGEGRWLLLPALLFAGFVAWRSSPVLQAINLGAVAAVLAVASFRIRSGRVRVGAVTETLWLGMLGALATITGAAVSLGRLEWRRVLSPAHSNRATVALRAALITLPVLVVFATLLASADEIFASALTAPLRFDAASAAGHTVRALVWAWIAAGLLHGTLIAPATPLPHMEPPPRFRLGRFEVTSLLGLVDALFLAFVAFQVRYLFGGADRVEVTDGLTYAEYARQGFFELLAVTALVLPLILGVHWLLRDRSPGLRVAFRVLAATLILLLYAIVASALQRMRIYVDEFGLTQLRLYSTAAMLWLVVVFAWLAATVLRDQRNRFAAGALAAALFAAAALNVLNPDAFIVETNLDRQGERVFDTAYALHLSPDATPTIVAALPGLPAEERCVLLAGIEPPPGADWRTWNYAREQARNALADADEPVDCP